MKTKYLYRIICVLALLYTIIQAQAQNQNWIWSDVIKDPSGMGIGRIVNDNNDNIYLRMRYNNITYPYSDTSNGCMGDALLAKYDSSGNFLWFMGFGGNDPCPSSPDYLDKGDYFNTLQLDTVHGYLYSSGRFYNSATFGSITLNSYTPNTLCYFFMKMDLDGNIIWVKRIPVEFYDMVNDNTGNLYIYGISGSNAAIDSINSVTVGGFLAKFNKDGDCIWVKNKIKKTGTSFEFNVSDIKLYNNNLILQGYTNNDTITVDTIIRYAPLNSRWSALLCFDTDGNAKWLSMYGGVSSLSGNDFSIDNTGNIYTTGYFTSTGYFGNDTLTGTAGQKNMFLVKHDINGNLLWAKQTGALSSDGHCVSNVVDSIIYVTGMFNGTAYFNEPVAAATTKDMFLAKYSTNGICMDVKHFGKAEGFSIFQNIKHEAYVSGIYYSDITIGDNSYTVSGSFNTFLAKLSGDTTTGIEMRKEVATNNMLTIYANPTTGKCNITIPEEFNYENSLILQIFDKSGKIIQQSKVEIFEENIKVNIESEAKGIYNVVLSNGVKSYNGKIVFE